eukprot:2268183-Pleurochrysis_carterae.AAC.1
MAVEAERAGLAVRWEAGTAMAQRPPPESHLRRRVVPEVCTNTDVAENLPWTINKLCLASPEERAQSTSEIAVAGHFLCRQKTQQKAASTLNGAGRKKEQSEVTHIDGIGEALLEV